MQMGPGDIALVRAAAHCKVCEFPDLQPQIIIYPGQDCRNLAGESVKAAMTHGVRTRGIALAG